MKRLLLLLVFIPYFLFSQTPQGVGYQGVATDAAGFELINQSISIRASVISNSATGTIEWQETHNTFTDTFGLFTLTIGQGTSTGNGALTSFADITWGANTHFLKIEMDVNGGTNYSHMGTNQMMSVPYALYAENANIDYDSISTILSNDSTFITTVSGGMGGGCDFKFPDGVDGDFLTVEIFDDSQNSIPYTVPTGKTFYITSAFAQGDVYITTDNGGLGHILYGAQYAGSNEARKSLINPIILSEGQTISGNGNQGSTISLNGFLTNTNITPISWEGATYQVPAGKKLYITNTGLGANLFIDNIKIDAGAGSHYVLGNPIVVNENQIVNPTNGVFNGYLADDDYFSNSGGSSAGFSNLNISQYGDSLFLGDNPFIIIPGLSLSNLHYQFFNYGTVTDIDGNIYKTLVYGDNEWMLENLKTATGNYVTPSGGSFTGYADSIGYYYSSADASNNVCPSGWHVATVLDWQELHYEIYGTQMNPSGFTNSSNGYDDNNYKVLWSTYEGGTNQSAFNLFNTGFWENGSSSITGSSYKTTFWTPEVCSNAGMSMIQIFSTGTGNNFWSLDVGCTSTSNIKAQIRCVKD